MSKSPARLLSRAFRQFDEAQCALNDAEMHADEMRDRLETAREAHRAAQRDLHAARARRNRAGTRAADCVFDAFRAA